MRIFFIIFIFFCACSSGPYTIQNASSLINLSNTQKIKINYDNLDYTILITYINPLLKINNKEIFILSILPNDIKAFDAFLKDQKANIIKLAKDDKILNNIIKNNYASYYKLSFDKASSNILELRVCIDECHKLSFNKLSKSLNYRKLELNYD